MRFNFYAAQINEEFDPVRILPEFETAEQVRHARRRIARALDDYAPEGRELARIFRECKMGSRCRSAACPVCLRRFRQWWSSEVAKYIATDRDGWYTVCIVDPDLAFPLGELKDFDWNLAKDRLRKQIERSSIKGAKVLGGFDYALQSFVDRAPKWFAHIYFLTQAGGAGRIRSALDPHYQAHRDTKVPVMTTPQKKTNQDVITTATYTFKSTFGVRQPTVDKRGNADTKYSALEPAHEAELALLLHRQGFLGRLIRRGVDQDLPALTIR